jgi:hypothetical protein
LTSCGDADEQQHGAGVAAAEAVAVAVAAAGAAAVAVVVAAAAVADKLRTDLSAVGEQQLRQLLLTAGSTGATQRPEK